MRNKLSNHFYQRDNVLCIARELLGKVLVTELEGIRCAGRIVEVEAYNGVKDKASHAWAGRRTARTEIMYAGGGVAYIYRCYGLHHLFNVVTSSEDIPHAILVRALEPLEGVEAMLQRSGKKKPDFSLTRGPGNAAKAMGLHVAFTGWSLQSPEIYITDDGYKLSEKEVVACPRIGVDYAGDDALLPYRFYILGNRYVSGRNK